MTGEVISLRRARKRKARAEAGAVADANRLQHGVSRAARAEGAARRDLAERRLAAHEREPAPTDDA